MKGSARTASNAGGRAELIVGFEGIPCKNMIHVVFVKLTSWVHYSWKWRWWIQSELYGSRHRL